MTINVRTKGQTGEREVAKLLNAIVAKVRAKNALPKLATIDELFQRNQNQSAVGGSDLSNPLYLDIEVKRQEALSINTWWTQVVDAADRSGGIPILIFRQNQKKWRICMFGNVPLQPTSASAYACLSSVRVEIDLPTFEHWFEVYYQSWVTSNAK